MPSYGTHRITDKKYATCSFWGGAMEIVPNRDKPFYIKALASIHPCHMMLAKKSGDSFCNKWSKWTVIR
ncbi:MAG: hypothetical protein HY096_03050 [Nitrospinae bacterium]|nr:hypothetical protein [Nitrospinota bacterium]